MTKINENNLIFYFLKVTLNFHVNIMIWYSFYKICKVLWAVTNKTLFYQILTDAFLWIGLPAAYICQWVTSTTYLHILFGSVSCYL